MLKPGQKTHSYYLNLSMSMMCGTLMKSDTHTLSAIHFSCFGACDIHVEMIYFLVISLVKMFGIGDANLSVSLMMILYYFLINP